MLAVFLEPTAEGPRVSQDGTTILFGLPGVRVREVLRGADGTRVVHVLTDDVTAAACPDCGVFSKRVRQRRTTRPRDLPYGEEPLEVRWHKLVRQRRHPRADSARRHRRQLVAGDPQLPEHRRHERRN